MVGSEEGEDEEPLDFECSRQRRFREILDVTGLTRDQILEILGDLPSFDSGSPEDGVSKGYKSIDLVGFVEAQNEASEEGSVIGDNLGDLATKSITQEFVEEKYLGEEDRENQEIVDGEGNRLETDDTLYLKSVEEDFVHYIPPGFITVQSAKTRAKERADQISTAIGAGSKAKFEHQFLLWLLEKGENREFGDNQLGPIKVEEVRDIKFSGELPELGREISVKESSDICHSEVSIFGTLYDMDIVELKIEFRLDGNPIMARIKPDHIHILSSRYLSRPESNIKKTLIALKFFKEFMAKYKEWEGGDPKDKYVHPDFFDYLLEIAEEKGIEDIHFDYDDIIEKQARKRGENPNSYDFDHIN